jgi:hypothetical protein
LCFSYESFVVLLKGMWDTPSRERVFLMQAHVQIDLAFFMFVLPDGCLQVCLEIAMANPYVTLAAKSVACKIACAFCAGLYETLFPLLVKAGIQPVLLQVFLGPEPASKATLDKELVHMV